MCDAMHTYSDGHATWDVRDLWKAAEGIEPVEMPICEVCDFDEMLDSYTWTRHGDWTKALTVREILEHADKVASADLSYPIILSPEGWVADGCHRIVRALREGHSSIKVIRLPKMPAELNGVTSDPF